MKICKKCLISGRVQGVFYRASTQRQAQSLGVTGWAKNLPDGTVEVMACGERDAVNALCDWCGDGPEYARVISIECEEQGFQVLSGFTTR
ncbi:MAG: acylphosphatase [Gammaproteobacteria bacterium]|nr:acylphosphatase [Gammaproteobacteria bacterium]MCK5091559.1 acylphosphatase [Gammaproteobacteria bacterium]